MNNPLKQTEYCFDETSDIVDFNLGEGVELLLYKQFYHPHEASRLFDILLSGLQWQEEGIIIFGKKAKVPRLMCWYGDTDAHYEYSGVNHIPLPWTRELQAIRKKIEQQCVCSFNSVLANLYRDGRDSMGCHADDEKELGVNPTIASLSLGEERLFRMHHIKSRRKLNINLQHGDLLIMGGACQRLWIHSVPKTKAPKSPRINLTFRKIMT